MRPLLLDLFCGAGGAAMGYYRAGFDVIGVDIKPQPHYPFKFHQADWISVNVEQAMEFDAIHASPPCQRYIRGGTIDKLNHPDYIGAVREFLNRTDRPWVIENVPGAPMRVDAQLCGSMFGLEVRRHRWFESNAPIWTLVSPCDHSAPVTGVYGNAHGARGAWSSMLPSNHGTWSRAMGIDWMTTPELADAIPPAYTQFIGEQLLSVLKVTA